MRSFHNDEAFSYSGQQIHAHTSYFKWWVLSGFSVKLKYIKVRFILSDSAKIIEL